jgi:hypothetical protein
LPTNDWTTLFQTVLFSPDSYLANQSNVFCFASATSIYHQIFPPNDIAFGYSAITEHWLSRKPCNIPDEIWSARATGNVREVWAAQAKADWHAFLQYRALEMRASARLLILSSGANEQGNSGAEGLIDLANVVLQQLVKDGARSIRRNTKKWRSQPIIGPPKSGKSPLLLIQILLSRFPLIILKNSRCPTFILSVFNATVMRRHSLKRTLGFSKQRSNRACS